MQSNKEDEVEIPCLMSDTGTGTTYMKGRFFGKGGFAKCYEITEMKTKAVYAGKIVSKRLLTKSNQKEKMTQEIAIHQSLRHQHVVGFHGFFEDTNFVYVVLELCRKRSMMELHKRRKAITEPEVRFFMKQILQGVLYLHDKGIIHRDLKLGNLFLNDDLEVKIGDFGLAAKIEYQGQRKKTLCGTPNYIAPEILNKRGHSFEVDVWSIGCIMFTLLVGKPPFETTSLRETYARIKRCEYRLPSSMRSQAAAMVHSMLQPEPHDRPTVKQLLAHDFFTCGYTPAQLPASCLVTAPRFDSLAVPMGKARRPLLEVNAGEHSPKAINMSPAKMPPPRASIMTGGSAPPPLLTNTSALCHQHLKALYKQVHQLVGTGKPRQCTTAAEEMSDPAAQPLVFVSKWVDYSDKYGFGYQLCDEGVGVVFNDNTKLVLLPNKTNVHYIESDGAEQYYTMGATPEPLAKKMKLLNYFRHYMSEHLIRAGPNVVLAEADSLSRIPYLHRWTRSTASVVMQLTNGTLQINFLDHTKVIMCPLMNAVTYIDAEATFRTYRFETLAKHGCVPGLATALEYSVRKIAALISDEMADPKTVPS